MKDLAHLAAAAVVSAALLAACSRTDSEPAVARAPAGAAAPAASPTPSASQAADTVSAPLAKPESSDPDNPVALPALELKGNGNGKAETRYYAFDAGAGQVTVTATAKNSSSGATQALGFALYDLKANRLCFDSHGNTTDDKTVVLNCQVEKPQRLLLRLDLSPESLDHRIVLSGPVTLIAPLEAAAADSVAGAGSTDIDAPMRLSTNRVKADGTGKPVSCKSAIKPEARTELHEAAERIKKFPGARVIVSGHTDNVGSDASNKALSTARAGAVRTYLVDEEHIDAAMLVTMGFGKTQPVAGNATEAGRARNRRVDLVITPQAS